jgi:hypothetical protein
MIVTISIIMSMISPVIVIKNRTPRPPIGWIKPPIPR